MKQMSHKLIMYVYYTVHLSTKRNVRTILNMYDILIYRNYISIYNV